MSSDTSKSQPKSNPNAPTVLHLISRLDGGGGSRLAIDLATALVEAGGRALIAFDGEASTYELTKHRITPITEPSRSAMTQAQTAADIVHPRPWISVMNHVLWPSADVSQRMPQFQLYLTACLPRVAMQRRRASDASGRPPARGRL